MSSSPLLSIIAAAGSSVGKTFLIGVVGFLATKFPKQAPLIPYENLSSLSRMTFNMLILPLTFTGVAKSVKLAELEILYPIILLSFMNLIISASTTMIIGTALGMRKKESFIPLCVASTFPNIVVLPLIVFPTLCEYEVVHDLIKEDAIIMDDTDDNVDLFGFCKDQVNAIVFTYFFGFCVVFWSVGYKILTSLKNRYIEEENIEQSPLGYSMVANYDSSEQLVPSTLSRRFNSIKEVLKSIFTAPGFISLMCGFIISCIPPLQRALFDFGGSVRVVGSALESIASTGSVMATIIVAASLVERKKSTEESAENIEQSNMSIQSIESPNNNISEEEEKVSSSRYDAKVDEEDQLANDNASKIEEPIDAKVNEDILKTSNNCSCCSEIDKDTWKTIIWQLLARLVVTPSIVFGILLKLDCSGYLDSIPNLSKLVLLVNSAGPGALIVVVILKAQGLADEAAIVSKTYFPSYTLSVISLAMWCILGLTAFHPDETMCR